MSFNPEQVKQDFPILSVRAHDHPLVYLDNGATTQKPQVVIDAVEKFYQKQNSNVHRGVHYLSQVSTDLYEGVREKVARFLNVNKTQEIIHTRGTTDSINLVAQSWGRKNISAGDVIVVSRMEHHSNFVTWQALAREKGAEFRIVELTADGRIDLDSYQKALEGKVKLVALNHMSNVLGTINPIAQLSKMAKEKGASVFVDGAQAVAHFPVNLPELGVDFYAFSAHKICGPTGVGVLWAREETLNQMDPYLYGGDMISRVGDQETTWNELPWKFEAGTPNIAGFIGLGAAIDYVDQLGMDQIESYETQLTAVLVNGLKAVEGLKIIGPVDLKDRGPVVSFVLDGVHPHDLATFLDQKGVATRAGHHCTQPLHRALGIPATTRASLSFYNTKDEVTVLVNALNEARKYFLRDS